MCIDVFDTPAALFACPDTRPDTDNSSSSSTLELYLWLVQQEGFETCELPVGRADRASLAYCPGEDVIVKCIAPRPGEMPRSYLLALLAAQPGWAVPVGRSEAFYKNLLAEMGRPRGARAAKRRARGRVLIQGELLPDDGDLSFEDSMREQPGACAKSSQMSNGPCCCFKHKNVLGIVGPQCQHRMLERI